MKSFPLPTVFEALDLVMRNYPDNFSDEVRLEIEALLDYCLDDLDECSERFLATLFIRAIRKHIDPDNPPEHIYLKKFEVSQIELFNLLVKQFPFVRYSHEIINKSIVNTVGINEKLTFLDVGIGQGVQTVALLNELSECRTLKEVTIIGIEPFQEALVAAEANILAHTYHFNVKFIPVLDFIEACDFATLSDVVKREGGIFVVNESLALHHIQDLANRHRVISAIRALNPASFFLTEPNVDHFEPDFYRRFQNCYDHFYHIFQVVDLLPVTSKEKNGLKMFFGREIEDIIGGNDIERFEKHEPSFRWAEKLTVNGFKTIDNFTGIPLDVGYGINLSFDKRNGCLGFRFKTETVISLIHAVCDN